VIGLLSYERETWALLMNAVAGEQGRVLAAATAANLDATERATESVGGFSARA